MMKFSDLDNVRNIRSQIDELHQAADAIRAQLDINAVRAGYSIPIDICQLLGADKCETALKALIDADIQKLEGQLCELGVDPTA